ncbi:hypothetical protein AB1N83_006526 [Pleurotus pulmonarius]
MVTSIQELGYPAAPPLVTVNSLAHDRNQRRKHPGGRMGFSASAIRPYGLIRKGSYGATVRLLQLKPDDAGVSWPLDRYAHRSRYVLFVIQFVDSRSESLECI